VVLVSFHKLKRNLRALCGAAAMLSPQELKEEEGEGEEEEEGEEVEEEEDDDNEDDDYDAGFRPV
jgi:ribosomal protein L12E/L44/L45/RPP1/RPP2